MTTCDEIRSQLSAFVDDEVGEADRAVVAAHLETCAACRGALDDVRQIAATARLLGPMTPPDHIWLEVAGQIRLGESTTPPRARRAARVGRGGSAAWQWIGLAAALVVATLGMYVFQGAGPTPGSSSPPASGNAERTGSVEAVQDELNLAVRHYENAIAELEQLSKQGGGEVDPGVATVVQRNLGAIDQAIAESRTALSDEPDNAPARDSLFQALRQKVSVLQATVSLINQMRQGDAAGAARIAGGGKRS